MIWPIGSVRRELKRVWERISLDARERLLLQRDQAELLGRIETLEREVHALREREALYARAD